MLTRDQMIREWRTRGASWMALAFVYSIIVGTMIVSAMTIT